MSTKDQLKRIAEKAKEINTVGNLGLAKSLLTIEDKIDNIKIPETDLSKLEKGIEDLKNEELVVELEII
jgi:hypothetical protein